MHLSTFLCVSWAFTAALGAVVPPVPEETYVETHEETTINNQFAAADFMHLHDQKDMFAERCQYLKEHPEHYHFIGNIRVSYASFTDCGLHQAIMAKDIEITNFVSSQPEDAIQTLSEMMSLYKAIKRRNVSKIMIRDQQGNSPLHLAVMAGDLHDVEVLVRDALVDVNANNVDGYTPFALAMVQMAWHQQNAEGDVLDMLISDDSHEEISQDPEFMQPYTMPQDDKRLAATLEAIAMKLLGRTRNWQNSILFGSRKHVTTPLHMAVYAKSTNLISFMFETQGESLLSWTLDGRGHSFFHEAIALGYNKIVRQLLDMPLPPSFVVHLMGLERSRSPVTLALVQRSFDLAKTLIEKEAPWDTEDDFLEALETHKDNLDIAVFLWNAYPEKTDEILRQAETFAVKHWIQEAIPSVFWRNDAEGKRMMTALNEMWKFVMQLEADSPSRM